MSARRLFGSSVGVHLVGSLVAGAAILAAATTLVFAAKLYRAEGFDVKLSVRSDGSMIVTETIRFTFGSDSFTSVYREVPKRRTDGITLIGASMDGRACVEGKGDGQFSLKSGENDRRRITWHFAPVSTSTHEFTLTYLVSGVVFQENDADVLRWTALPEKHEYAIDTASIALEYPGATTLLSQPVLAPAAASSRMNGFAWYFERFGFNRDKSWIVTARFAPRTVAIVMPEWQQRSLLRTRNAPMFAGLAGLILFSGIGCFVVFKLNHRPLAAEDSRARLSEPPDQLPAGLAGVLSRVGTGARWCDAMGTMLELIDRGVLHVEQVRSSNPLKRRDFSLTPASRPANLAPHEQAVLDMLFTTRSGPRKDIRFSQMARVVGSVSRWKLFKQAVTQQLRREGLMDAERERTRQSATRAGVGILVVGIMGLLAAVPFIDTVGEFVLLIPISLLVTGVVGMAIGGSLTPFSDEGLRRARSWQAYRRYLDDVAKAKPASTATGPLFERALPYAAAFGVALAWAKGLQKQGLRTGPAWLGTLSPDGTHAHDIGAMVDMLSAGASAGSHVDGGTAGAGAAAAA